MRVRTMDRRRREFWMGRRARARVRAAVRCSRRGSRGRTAGDRCTCADRSRPVGNRSHGGERAPDGSSVFTVMCDLPPGYHQYKFIVDGQWRHDENQAFIQDRLGNANNWLHVKPAEGRRRRRRARRERRIRCR